MQSKLFSKQDHDKCWAKPSRGAFAAIILKKKEDIKHVNTRLLL